MVRLTGDFKSVSMFSTSEEAKIYNRLREYEDTGLTPKDIEYLKAKKHTKSVDPFRFTNMEMFTKGY